MKPKENDRLCLFILLYVGHQAFGVHSRPERIIKVQLVVKGAFPKDRRESPFPKQEERPKSHYGGYYENDGHRDASGAVHGVFDDVGCRTKHTGE